MARFDSHLKRIEQRLRAQEAKRLSGSFAEALREFSESGKLPDHPGMKAEILKWHETLRQMVATMPTKTIGDSREGDSPKFSPEKWFPKNEEK
jgi:hypothetical protein